MSLQIRHRSSYKVRMLATTIAVMALAIQPAYSFINYQIAHATSAPTPTLQACTAYSNIETTNLSTWDLSQTRSNGHNELVGDGLHVWTDSNTSTDKAAGYYPASFKLADLGAGFGLTSTGSGTPPALQLTVDLDGNGTPDGNLVAEPAAYGANTLWLSSNWTGLDLSQAPTAFDGGGTGKGGTVNAWLAAFPNAKVVAIGYSLGSGVKGDSTITKITAGCVNYTFTQQVLSAPILVSPGDNGYSTTNDFYFTWNAVSGAATYEFQSDNNSSFSHPWDSIANGNSAQKHLTTPQIHSTGAPDGTYYWRVRALDANGVPGAWSDIWKMTIDTVAPAVPTNLSWKTDSGATVTSGGYTNIQKGVLSWNATNPSDINHYVYKFWTNIPGYHDGEGNAWTTSSSQYFTPTSNGSSIWTDFGYQQGTYYFCVEAVDAAGNTSACSGTYSVTYDATAPVVAITSPSAAKPLRGTVTINGTVSDANPDHYYLVVENSKGQVVYGPGTVNQATVSSVSWNTKSVADGTYTIILAARDKAGNKDTATMTVTVDNTPPAAPTITPASGTNIKGSQTFTVTKSDASDSLTVSSSVGTLVDNGNGTYTLDTTAMAKDTQVVITATETDEAGNYTTQTATYKVENAAPTVSGITMGHDTNGQYWLTGNSTNSAGSKVAVLNNGTLFAGPVAVNADGSWTVPLGALPKSTSYDFTVTIANMLGYSSSLTQTFTTAPLQTTLVRPSVTQGLLRSFAPVATPVNTATNPAPVVKDDSNKGILGAQTTKPDKNISDTSVLSPSSQGWKIFGFAWYWWLILIAAIAALWYWLAAARRRRSDEAAYLNK